MDMADWNKGQVEYITCIEAHPIYNYNHRTMKVSHAAEVIVI